MKSKEDFVIKHPYVLTDDDKASITKAVSKGLSTATWKDDELKNFKSNIREYLREKQNGYCAFCRMKVHDENATGELEHFVNKAKRLDWMFLPKNLVFSCKLCNTSKSTKEAICNLHAPNYPTNPNDFLLVYPYKDRYSEHIEIRNDIIYVGKTTKGKATVDVCHLNRLEVTSARAENVIKSEAHGFVSVFLLVNNPAYAAVIEDKDKLIKRLRLKERIASYKKKHK